MPTFGMSIASKRSAVDALINAQAILVLYLGHRNLCAAARCFAADEGPGHSLMCGRYGTPSRL